jgi:hypothetical protein
VDRPVVVDARDGGEEVVHPSPDTILSGAPEDVLIEHDVEDALAATDAERMRR